VWTILKNAVGAKDDESQLDIRGAKGPIWVPDTTTIGAKKAFARIKDTTCMLRWGRKKDIDPDGREPDDGCRNVANRDQRGPATD